MQVRIRRVLPVGKDQSFYSVTLTNSARFKCQRMAVCTEQSLICWTNRIADLDGERAGCRSEITVNALMTVTPPSPPFRLST